MASRGNRRIEPARHAPLPGWALLLVGLALGAIGFATWDLVREQLAADRAEIEPAEPAAQSAPQPQPQTQPRPKPRRSEAPPEKRYGFYDMLPNFEVVVPEVDGEVRADKTAAAITAPGVYVLQAGSYANREEAERVQTRLTALGIGSQVQRILVDDREFHRVRIGPIEKLNELNRTRQLLRNARIDALLIRVGE